MIPGGKTRKVLEVTGLERDGTEQSYKRRTRRKLLELRFSQDKEGGVQRQGNYGGGVQRQGNYGEWSRDKGTMEEGSREKGNMEDRTRELAGMKTETRVL